MAARSLEINDTPESHSRRVHRPTGRRAFLNKSLGLSSLLLAPAVDTLSAEPPLEIRQLRIAYQKSWCVAPQFVAEQLLRAEGFTDISYPRDWKYSATRNAANGDADFALGFSGQMVSRIDAGDPIVVLAGVHTGCYELFATNGVGRVRDLQHKSVGVWQMGGDHHIFVASMAAYVGLDPQKDIRWVAQAPELSISQLASGTIDAYLAFVPEQYKLREARIGHSILNTTTDRPWSDYLCCMLAANREFVRKYPGATRRVVRSILKAADLCAADPVRAATLMVEAGYAQRHDYAVQTLRDIPYTTWRTHDPADTLRFFALRLREVGMIRDTPHRIIARGADWRILEEVRRELKG